MVKAIEQKKVAAKDLVKAAVVSVAAASLPAVATAQTERGELFSAQPNAQAVEHLQPDGVHQHHSSQSVLESQISQPDLTQSAGVQAEFEPDPAVIKLIAETKAAGVSLDYLSAVGGSGTFALDGKELASFGVDREYNSVEGEFNLRHGIKKELPASIRSKQPAEIFAFELDAEHVSGDVYSLSLEDRLTGDTPFTSEIDLGDKEKLDAAKTKVSRTVGKIVQDREVAHRELIEKIEPALGATSAVSLSPQRLPPETQKNLEQLIESGYHLEFEIDPSGANSEDSSRFYLTKSNLAGLDGRGLIIDGQVSEIVVEGDLVEKLPNFDPKKPVEQRDQDQFGNLYSERFSYWSQSPTEYKQRTRIFSQRPYGQSGQAEADQTDLPFAVPVAGIEPVRGFLSVREATAQGQIASYPVFSDTEIQTNPDYQAAAPEIAAGVARAEKLFGISGQSQLERLYIKQSAIASASFDRADPATIVFNTASLTDKSQLQNLAQHETIHLIDNQYTYQLTDEQSNFGQQFKKVEANSERFFGDINEKAFHPEIELTGHAHSNPREFLASLLTSATRDNWERRIDTHQQWSQSGLSAEEFKTNYRQSLQALEADLAGAEGVNPEAEIHKLLQSRITYLSTQED